ncbi:MAG: hypothetical protein ISR65_18925 [Bacteriovoracaceae bacterium]|nr:hypothetical protein [Bacteriovoracaceae bacterium]
MKSISLPLLTFVLTKCPDCSEKHSIQEKLFVNKCPNCGNKVEITGKRRKLIK